MIGQRTTCAHKHKTSVSWQHGSGLELPTRTLGIHSSTFKTWPDTEEGKNREFNELRCQAELCESPFLF